MEDNDAVIHGCVPLAKGDDDHFISELQCFVRANMMEIFTVKEDDMELEDEDSGIILGQVGIRCSACARLPEDERPEGHAYFPKSISAIHQNASDLQRRHFMSCNEIPHDAKKSFQSLKGFAAKAEAETQQYWINSARELGLANYEDSERDGIRLFRDPTGPSPADLADKEREQAQSQSKKKGSSSASTKSKSILVRPADVTTDHTYLLMQQVRPCRFKNSDRRGGPGSRGRDRVLGFPGIACRHCSSKNNFGRYFPFASKSLGDNTANQMQTHMTTCSRCPEKVKSSLAYLSHRASLQKVEMGGGWKKAFYKFIWERLHVERAWSSTTTNTGKTKKKSQENKMSMNMKNRIQNHAESSDDDRGHGHGRSANGHGHGHGHGGSDHEEVDEMVKAAATWLTKRDAKMEVTGPANPLPTRTKANRGRGLPSGRGLPTRKRQNSSISQPSASGD
mmetsp:Transcript_17633/g.26709  ORF Transcript_17633/g.26709 Transcript_17633/m.26709 type:complete len:451 (+) Transcript_17633:3-1355(+)